MEPLSVAVTCLNLAQSLGLFGERAGGLPVGALLDQQFRLLGVITASLDLLHNDLESLRQDLAEIRLLARKMPSAVAIELLKIDVAAALKTYRELLETYELERKRFGIEAADRHISDFIQLADRIRELRNRAFTINSEIVIPGVSALIMAESHCLICAGGHSSRLAVALMESQRWFTSWLASDNDQGLPTSILEIAKDIESLQKSRAIARPRFCDFVFGANNKPYVSDTNGFVVADLVVSKISDLEELDELVELHEVAADLERKGAPVPASFWSISNYRVELVNQQRTVNVGELYLDSEYSRLVQRILATESRWKELKGKPSLEAAPDFATVFLGEKHSENLQFDEARARTLAFCGYFVVARQASDFCERMSDSSPPLEAVLS